MNLFDEFLAIAREFQRAGIPYATVGGVALAIHDEPRFTRDIEILVTPEHLEDARVALQHLSYFESSAPWTFAQTQLTLHRFMKTEGEDFLVVDILCGSHPRHREIVRRATQEPWSGGLASVANKDDLIWMKEQRASEQDRVDIARLRNDQDRKSSPTAE